MLYFSSYDLTIGMKNWFEELRKNLKAHTLIYFSLNVKIFISYSRRDAGDFADRINEVLKEEHDIFTDVDDIEPGAIWTNVIEENISRCDIFIVIVTFAALKSSEVEKEVLQALKKNKKIIPCVYRGIKINQLKWDLGKFQGIVFKDEYALAREIYQKIKYHGDKIQTSTDTNKESRPTVKVEPAAQPVKSDPAAQPVKSEPSVSVSGKPPRSKMILLLIIGAVIGSIILAVLLTYHPNNQVPLAHDQSITTNTNVPAKITLSADDKDNNDLTAAIVDKPTHGNLSSINQDTGVLTYSPNPGFIGSDKFTFKVNDGKADSNNGIISITVKPTGNNNPVAHNQSITTNTNVPAKITLSADDKDNNDLTAAIVDKPTHGNLSSINQDTGVLTYSPNPGFIGSDKFTFKVNDGKADSNNGIITITIK
jgi:hypothetical protein